MSGTQIRLLVLAAISAPAFEMLIASLMVPNSAAISSVAGYIQLIENVAASVIQLTTNRMRHFRQKGKL